MTTGSPEPVVYIAMDNIGSSHGTELDAGIQVALAKGIATLAHKGQTDKLGAAYITHPARVAFRFDAHTLGLAPKKDTRR